MEQFKRARVIMLPKNGEKLQFECNCKNPEESHHFHCGLVNYNNRLYLNGKLINLYIISDEDLLPNEYGINIKTNTIIQNGDKNNNVTLKDWENIKRIIATTDTNLILDVFDKKTCKGDKDCSKHCDCLVLKHKGLPQPSQQFIEKYIEEYNRGNIITDILVEYEFQQLYKGKLNYQDMILNVECYNHDYNKLYKESNVGRFHKGKIISRETNCNGLFLTDKGEKQFCTLKELFFENLKINPKDNTITIKKLKDSWDREEMEEILLEALQTDGPGAYNMGWEYKDAKKWIEENL